MRRVRYHNDRWRTAMTKRREFLAELLRSEKSSNKSSKPGRRFHPKQDKQFRPKRAQQFILQAMALGGDHLTSALRAGSRSACESAGLKPRWGQDHPMLVKARRATQDEALMMTLRLVLYAMEEAYDPKHMVNTWRRPRPEDELYFGYLKECGYTLTPTEQLVLDPNADAQDWPHLQDSTSGAVTESSALDPHLAGEPDEDHLDVGEDPGEPDPDQDTSEAGGPVLADEFTEALEGPDLGDGPVGRGDHDAAPPVADIEDSADGDDGFGQPTSEEWIDPDGDLDDVEADAGPRQAA
jgi:ParB family chromosome partitioning protein